MNKWTDSDIKFLRNHIGKIPVREIAVILGRTYRAVNLYCYRNGIATRKTLSRPIMKLLLEAKFGDIKYFIPDRKWFESAGISQKRFSVLKYGYEQPTSEEVKKVMKALNMAESDREKFVNSLQLELFTDNQDEI